MKTPRQLLLERHRSAEADLDKIRQAVVSQNLRKAEMAPESVSFLERLWLELFVPARGIWAGIAVTWLIILVLHGVTIEQGESVAKEAAPTKTQVEFALREKQRILAEINEDFTVADKPKAIAPRPRSDTLSATRIV